MVFQWLPEYFEYMSFEFGQFIQKKYAIMGQGNLSGLGIGSPTDEGYV